MAKVIAVCNNVPDTVQTLLNELGYKDITYLAANERLPAKLKTDILFVFSFPDFRANLKELNGEAYEKKVVFLFCPVVQAKTLENIQFLDVELPLNKVETVTAFYKNASPDLLKALMEKKIKSKKVSEKDKQYKYVLVDAVRSGSLLNPLMTLLYTVKAEGGVKIKELVLAWLVSKDNIKALEKKLDATYEFGAVSQRFRVKLIELLSSELGKNYKAALTEVSKKDPEGKDTVTSIAKKYNIDDYEVRYIVNVMTKKRKTPMTGKTIDQLYKKEMKTLKN